MINKLKNAKQANYKNIIFLKKKMSEEILKSKILFIYADKVDFLSCKEHFSIKIYIDKNTTIIFVTEEDIFIASKRVVTTFNILTKIFSLQYVVHQYT